MKSVRLCDRKPEFLQAQALRRPTREAWGSGEEVYLPAGQGDSGAEESYFFNQDGFLVGALFLFPHGLALKPYDVLRDTLQQLKPVTEFYLDVSGVPKRDSLESTLLYETGQERTTDRYLVLGQGRNALLLAASFAIDPYAALLSPYRRQFMARVALGKRDAKSAAAFGQGSEDKEPFIALQEFARGETALLAYCGAQDYDLAADAYGRAVKRGFSDPARMAEGHHKLGLAYRGQGKLELARVEMEAALNIQPHRADILNNLGDVYRSLGKKEQALAAFERAVTLRPNYPVARFNLAEAYAERNPARALTEYETYLAIADGLPEERERIARAKERVKALRH